MYNGFKLPILMPLDIQLFAEPGEPGATTTEHTNTVVPSSAFGMTEFTNFLGENENAQAFFNAKLEAAVLNDRQSTYQDMVEKAKAEVSHKDKEPWEIEIEKLKAENEQNKLVALQSGIKSELTAKLAENDIKTISPELIHKFCLKDSAEASLNAYNELNAVIQEAAKEIAERTINERMNGYAHNPIGGGRGAQVSKDSVGVGIAKQIASDAAVNNKRANNARSHYFK